MMVGHNYRHKEVKLDVHQIKRPEGSKTPKAPKTPNAPKAPNAPNASKAPKAPKAPNAYKVNIPIDNAGNNVSVDHVPSETHTSVSHDLIDSDMLAKILFDDEVPEMLSERLHCSAPVDHVPVDNVLDVVNIDGPGKDSSTPLVIEDGDYCDDVHEDLDIDPKIGPRVQAIRSFQT
ncbi:hypothetical protein TSUD_159070 [Trifolium subterraneum]|uniref:Uncharacterized protein n=1 Tax=Trifolium subterraneum TaxID=3900 RepID=A0A2Z6NU92_TRISU|nr:hypothetical protein TSUD_159070 [Trifolium subterraneum]